MLHNLGEALFSWYVRRGTQGAGFFARQYAQIWIHLNKLLKTNSMGFHQYHEPPEELSDHTRTFARMITSLVEETEAIGMNIEFNITIPDDVAEEIKTVAVA